MGGRGTVAVGVSFSVAAYSTRAVSRKTVPCSRFQDGVSIGSWKSRPMLRVTGSS